MFKAVKLILCKALIVSFVLITGCALDSNPSGVPNREHALKKVHQGSAKQDMLEREERMKSEYVRVGRRQAPESIQ